jgi:RNA binding exosome subunit
MKTLKAITSDEMLDKVIERIESNDVRHDLSHLSQLACDYWAAQGGLVLEGMEGLKQACAEHGAFTDEADLNKLADLFLEKCGWDKYREPKHFCWAHNGNPIYLTKFTAEEDQSMCEALESWVERTWAEVEEREAWTA